MRVVLDTNVIVSALVYEGESSRLVPAWRRRRMFPLASPETTAEYIRVIKYQKFKLSEDRTNQLLYEELLPILEAVTEFKGRLTHPCKDPDDDKFLRVAIGGSADCLVTGDAALLALNTHYDFKILTTKELLVLLR